MDLAGWDTLSIVSIARVNEALAKGGARLIQSFDYTDGAIRIAGEFGPWRIGKGGSVRLLNMHIPIASATVSGMPGGEEVKIEDVVIAVEIGLKFLPSKTDGASQELRFDFDDDPASGRATPVYPKGVVEGGEDLSPIIAQLLPQAVAACIAQNADAITFTFAKIGVAGPPDTSWLDPVKSNWRYLQTQDGGGFLAIMSAVTDRPIDKLSDNVDPLIFSGGGEAFYAFSNELFLEQALAPYLQASFGHGAQFAYAPKPPDVKMTHRASLAKQEVGTWPFNYEVRPYINSMTFKTDSGHLIVDAAGRAEISNSYYLDFTHQSKMPFQYDAKSGGVHFTPDAHPKETHRITAQNKIMEFLFGWFIRLIASFISGAISGIIRGTANRLTGMTTPPAAVVGWSGVRPFKTTAARLEDAFIFVDANQ